MKSYKWLLIVVIGLLGAFITYQVYNFSNEWSFTIAFLGGAVTIGVAEIICRKHSN